MSLEHLDTIAYLEDILHILNMSLMLVLLSCTFPSHSLEICLPLAQLRTYGAIIVLLFSSLEVQRCLARLLPLLARRRQRRTGRPEPV